MASKIVAINNTSYTKLDTGTDTAILAQVLTNATVGFIFSASAPADSAAPHIRLNYDQAVQRNGATGDIYAKSIDAGNVNIGVVE